MLKDNSIRTKTQWSITTKLLIKIMNIFLSCGWETKGLATTGGAVSPSYVKMEPSCKLTVMGSKLKHYGKKTTSY